jgi:cell division septation protein DedD
MTQTDGEKELVLGNKQLISLFFVVVALCGVFFAGGYMIGRNTSKTAIANSDGTAAAAAASPVPRSQDSEPPRETAGEEPQPSSPAPADSQPAPESPDPSTQTQAAHDIPVVPAAAPGASPAASFDKGGATWLQVTALRRADADNLVKTLKEQNFPVALAESSKPELFRVMVGPYHQTSDVADAKTRLKALGFANAFVQK